MRCITAVKVVCSSVGYAEGSVGVACGAGVEVGGAAGEFPVPLFEVVAVAGGVFAAGG